LITAGTFLGPVVAVSELIWCVSAAPKISCDHCREYDPRTARTGPTAICPKRPLGWLVTAASSIVIGDGWLDAWSGNDYLLTGRTLLGSIVAVVSLRRCVIATAKVLCNGPSAVVRCRLGVSVKALSRCHQRDKGVYPEHLSFGCFDRVCTGAQRDVGRGEPLLDVELLGQEHSTYRIDSDINIFNLGNGATVDPL